MSQQPRKKQKQQVTKVDESKPRVVAASDRQAVAGSGYGGELAGDEDGYLVIALAAMVVLIVGLAVVMIVLAAT